MNTATTNSKRRQKNWRRIATSAIIMYLTILAVLLFFERSLLFPAPPVAFGNWQPKDFGAQESFVENSGAKIHVWTLLHKNSKQTIIVSHGNGETLGVMGEHLAEIRDRWAVNVVAFDFRGYGKTGGLATEKDILSDAVAVSKWVQANESFQGHQFIALGRSLGGACAVEMATQTKVDGLILDRTFSSIVDVAAARYSIFPVRLLMRNQFRSIEKIPNYSGPLLQMHGDVDEVVPFRFGKKLFEASLAEPKEFIPIKGLHHNAPWPGAFWVAGKKFLEQLEVK